MRSFLKSDEARKLLSGKPFAVFVVCRQFWRENLEAVRELAGQQGGRYVDEIHFTYPGDPLRSMLSLTSYLGSGEYRKRYLGLRIPPTNVQPEQLEQTRTFAARLADRLFGKTSGDASRNRRQDRYYAAFVRCVGRLARQLSNRFIRRSATRTIGWPGLRPSMAAPRWNP